MKEKTKLQEVPELAISEPAQEKISELDQMNLTLAKMRHQVANSEAKAAIAINEQADLAYKYIVLQLYMRYGLSEADAIDASGNIVRGGAVPGAQ